MNQPPTPPPVDSTPMSPSAPQKNGAGWFAAVWPVVIIATCAELGISVLNNSALPIYFTRGLHISTKIYGLIMAMFFVSEVLFKSPLGALADRIGRRPLMLGGAAVTIFTPILLLSMHYNPFSATAVATLVGFGVLRAMDGLGEAALWPSLYAYVGDVVVEAQRGAAMGVLNLVYMVGIAFSFLAGGYVDDTFGPVLTHQQTLAHQMHQAARNAGQHFRTTLHGLHGFHGLHHFSLSHPVPVTPLVAAPVNFVPPPVYQPEYYYPSFYLTAALFTVAVIAGLFLRAKGRPAHGEAGHEHHEEEPITWESFVAVVEFAGIGCISLLVKKFALDEFHVTETQFGQLVLGPALLIGLCAVPAGRLADHWGKARTMQLGFSMAALGLWGIPILHHLLRHDLIAGQAAFVGAGVVMGVGSVLAFPAWLAILTSLCGDNQRGKVFGAVSTAQGVGALIGALLGTTLYDVGHIVPFVAAAVLTTAGALLALLFVRERPQQAAP
jgi:DHA1 family multidrug resistance protein-like MFS transporter